MSNLESDINHLAGVQKSFMIKMNTAHNNLMALVGITDPNQLTDEQSSLINIVLNTIDDARTEARELDSLKFTIKHNNDMWHKFNEDMKKDESLEREWNKFLMLLRLKDGIFEQDNK